MSVQEELDNFEEVADQIEKRLNGDVRIVIDQNHDKTWHVEVQETAEEEDEDDWACYTNDGWFTINEKRNCASVTEATLWLEANY